MEDDYRVVIEGFNCQGCNVSSVSIKAKYYTLDRFDVINKALEYLLSEAAEKGEIITKIELS